jgi:hypothetical protein
MSHTAAKMPATWLTMLLSLRRSHSPPPAVAGNADGADSENRPGAKLGYDFEVSGGASLNEWRP